VRVRVRIGVRVRVGVWVMVWVKGLGLGVRVRRAGESFSRSDEAHADEFSVRYLCPTHYKADGAAGFFEKIEAEGGSSVPEFLSTHPSPDSRVQNIKNWKIELGCKGATTTGDYNKLLNSLP
ncbi:MAG: M48 family metalloprotease, partial [Saprospiraceae bacterium]|nr:M48 family metalloprotease [Saprospiraceae bacterium]